jgi:hypothetical protein
MTTNTQIKKPKSKKANSLASTDFVEVTINLESMNIPPDVPFAIKITVDDQEFDIGLGRIRNVSLPVGKQISFLGNLDNSHAVHLHLNDHGEFYIPIENSSAKMMVDNVTFNDLPHEAWHPITSFKVTQTPGDVPSIGILIVGTLPEDEDKNKK